MVKEVYEITYSKSKIKQGTNLRTKYTGLKNHDEIKPGRCAKTKREVSWMIDRLLDSLSPILYKGPHIPMQGLKDAKVFLQFTPEHRSSKHRFMHFRFTTFTPTPPQKHQIVSIND